MRPAPWRRSSAAQRRQHRAEFRALKERVASSSDTLKRQAKARADNVRAKALAKVKGALVGEAIRPFSMAQAVRIKPAEHEQLRAEVLRRLNQLSGDQRRALTANQHLILVTLTVDQMRAIAASEG